jgi:hypothetical protein
VYQRKKNSHTISEPPAQNKASKALFHTKVERGEEANILLYLNNPLFNPTLNQRGVGEKENDREAQTFIK